MEEEKTTEYYSYVIGSNKKMFVYYTLMVLPVPCRCKVLKSTNLLYHHII